MLAFAGILLILNPSYPRTVQVDSQPPDTLSRTRELNEVVVNGMKWKGRDKIGQMSISGVEINSQPVLLGEHDVIKTLQTTSGVVAGTEGFAGLYVRGGETDQNLYLLDGLPLLNVYHFGGLFSTFSTHSIEKVDFYKGAFPSLFGERASSIVDIALKKTDYYKTLGTFSVGLISGQLYFSTPLKKGNAALSVSLRRTWFDVFSLPALAIMNVQKKSEGKKIFFNYNFTDALVKASVTDRRNNEISLLMFFGKDNFKLGEELFDPEDEKVIYQRDLNKLSWGNWGIAFDYRLSTRFGYLQIQPYVSKAFASDIQENISDEGKSGHLISNTEIKPSVLQVGMRESLSFPIVQGLDGEAGLQQVWYDYTVGNPLVRYTGTTVEMISSPFANHSRNTILSGFGELNWNMGGIFQGSAGLRANSYFSKEMKHWNLEPRLGMKVNLPYGSNVGLSYSRVVQYAQQVSSNYMYLPSDAWLPIASYQKPLLCDIYSLGYFKNFKWGFSVKTELWWKNMRNLAEYAPNTSVITTTLPWYRKMTFGKGWAYGLDIEVAGNFKSINWNVSYGLMWNWRKFKEINSGKHYPAKFDNRHKLDISVGWTINDRLELTGQWEYMTGNRITLALYNTAPPDVAFPDAPFVNPIDPGAYNQDGMDYYESRNNVRIPAFHRLNLNMSIKGSINKKLSYQWDFGLYNAYCRMNPFMVIKNYVNSDWMNNNGDYRKFKTLSLLPILPSISYTLNF